MARVVVDNGRLESLLFDPHSEYLLLKYLTLQGKCLLVTQVVLKRNMAHVSSSILVKASSVNLADRSSLKCQRSFHSY